MNNEKWFVSGEQRVNLIGLTRLYPAVLIHAGGESASVSLEWAKLKADVITIEAYLLVCDFDPIGEVPLNRVELRFPTEEALFEAMQEVSQILNS